jgi:cyclopropane fatty-acyl-phospholipid synthase-like methyltransferase
MRPHQLQSPSLIPEGSGRRREKRRHNTTTSAAASSSNELLKAGSNGKLNLKEPLDLLELAVEIDARKIEFLKEPLEGGRLFNPNEEEFQAIVQKLSEPIRETPEKAWTPIVLSGLLQQQAKQNQSNNSPGGSANNNNTTPTTDLVNHAHILRSQALLRRKRRKELHRFRVVGVTLMICFFVVASVQRSLVELGFKLDFLGYMGSSDLLLECTEIEGEEAQDLCHQVDARVWSAVRDYPLYGRRIPCKEGDCSPSAKNSILKILNRIPGRKHSVDRELDHHAPYALHTVVTQGVRRKSRKESNPQHKESVRWLGDSRLMQLIRQHVGKRQRILDVGCGMSSLLYALSPRPRNYTGISTSPAAIQVSNLMIQHHGMVDIHARVELKQKSLYHQMQSNLKYDAIVAVESLSQQTQMGIDLIVEKLSHLLNPQGRLIIVDDVIAQPHLKNPDANRQLLSHANWTNIFRRNFLHMDAQRDLGLEFTLPQLESSSSAPFHQNNNNHQALSTLLQWAEPFVKPYPRTRRLLRLFQDTLALNVMEEKRALAHQEGKLMYALYVGTKVPVDQRQQQQQQCTPQHQQQQCTPEEQELQRIPDPQEQ